MKKIIATKEETFEVIRSNNMIALSKYPGWYINKDCLALHITKTGYRLFDWKQGTYNVHINGKTLRLSTLIATLFVEKPEDWDARTWDCYHIGDSKNNTADNLKWISRSENMRMRKKGE